MIIRNANVYTENGTFQRGDVSITKDIFSAAPADRTDDAVIDAGGCYAIPGLIDLHLHGCMGYDFCDGTIEAIQQIAAYELRCGVTAFAPATMTLPCEELEQILSVAANYVRHTAAPSNGSATHADFHGADLVGVNMEGPFISHSKKGAQNAQYIRPCDTAIAKRFLQASHGLVKFLAIAPEENPDFIAFITQMQPYTTVSLAHTNADYDTAMAAFAAGARHAVHLYNAMPSFTHRAPGVIGAVMDSPHVCAEIICDGIHVHPSAVRAAFRMMGATRMIFISDSMRATGMPDGRYMLGGLEVDVTGNRAVLASNGALAGSVTNLMDCLRVAVRKMGIPLEKAVACATINPARSLGIAEQYGSIHPGKKANLLLLDEALNLQLVMKDGIVHDPK